jgi:FlaA1/EpsC-like NDP-sugar epimerase
MDSYQKISFESIIGRDPKPAHFSPDEIVRFQGERFLVTGAGGSIGSRIVKLLSTIPNIEYLATDRDESSLHSLSLSLTKSALFDSDRFELLDIRDQAGVDESFLRYRPTTVIHAAALKHLSVLQKQPREAILTNVFGTANVLEAAKTCGATNFINISTDKAASPTSVLGMTKHLVEIYTAEYRADGLDGYTNCRFGNVFNSRGSVIETFAKQMTLGAPITLTDSAVTRFFMHVDEAAFLTLKSFLGNLGDVHIFEMGDPVLMFDIVKKMQQVLSTSSQVIITGLREGEKLHEQLIEVGVQEIESDLADIRVLRFEDNYRDGFIEVLDFVRKRNLTGLSLFLEQMI